MILKIKKSLKNCNTSAIQHDSDTVNTDCWMVADRAHQVTAGNICSSAIACKSRFSLERQLRGAPVQYRLQDSLLSTRNHASINKRTCSLSPESHQASETICVLYFCVCIDLLLNLCYLLEITHILA